MRPFQRARKPWELAYLLSFIWCLLSTAFLIISVAFPTEHSFSMFLYSGAATLFFTGVGIICVAIERYLGDSHDKR